ncbi:TPA: hypothetical protein HA318_04300 [Candidatus Micrarchaeota archaeon]|nr:hypothetical protein [Candidatus Micrarchaeota archaeon]
MELDLPYGPWTRLVTAQWGKYPLAIYQNPEKLVMLMVFEKRDENVTGAVMLLKKVFYAEGDLARFMQAQKREVTLVEKYSKDNSGRYLMVGATPEYCAYSQDALVGVLKKQYLELEGVASLTKDTASAYGFKLTDFSLVDEAQTQLLLGDPFSLFAYTSAGGTGPGTSAEAALHFPKLLLGLDREKKEFEIKLDSLYNAAITGGTRESRRHLMHVILEGALQNGVTVLIFDSGDSFRGFGLPNRDSASFSEFGMSGTPTGFPFKVFELGEGLYVDLSKIDADAFLRGFYLSGSEVAEPIKAAYDAKRASLFSLSDVINELASMKESKSVSMFNLRRAVRVLQVLQKMYPSLFAKNISADLATPWRDAVGKVLLLNLKKYPLEIQRMLIATVIEAIPVPPSASLSLVLAFENEASQVSNEIQSALSKYRGQGVGILMHEQHEVDVRQFGELTAAFESIGMEAIGAQKGERPLRFALRPTYSQCTEKLSSDSAMASVTAPVATAIQKPPLPVASPVQEKKPLFKFFAPKKEVSTALVHAPVQQALESAAQKPAPHLVAKETPVPKTTEQKREEEEMPSFENV